MRALLPLLVLVLVVPTTSALPLPRADGDPNAFTDAIFEPADDSARPMDPADAMADFQNGAFRPVLRNYYDSYWSCDLNADGHVDLVVQLFNTDTKWSYLYAYSGADGSLLWMRYNWDAGVGIADLYERESEPQPRVPIKPINLRPAGADLDGDGVCDFIQFTVVDIVGLLGTPPARASTGWFELSAISGIDGSVIWLKEYRMNYVISDWMRNSLYWVVEGQNIPTDLEVFTGEEGVQVVLKTSDIFFHRFLRPVPEVERPPDPWNYHIWNSEHIFLLDATNGQELWTRDILFTEDPERTRFTWISGLTDVTGDGRTEVVLDQYYRSTPTYEDLKVPPQSEENVADPGRGMNVIVLDGKDGTDLWRVNLRDEEYYRKNPRTEETFEALKWTYAQVLPDVNGDGKDDVVALFLTQKINAGATVNGAFTTHIIPLDGATGALLWKNDVRIQGWGFVTTLHTPDRHVPAIAAGTVDITSEPPPGGKFPHKEVRISLLNVTDGTPLWTYEERFAQSSYLSSDLALQQYLQHFAPYDWTGDGVLDILTPSSYVPAGDGQVLLSNAKSEFRILDGDSGKMVRTIEVRGSNAAAAPCVSDDGDITTVSGHAQRLDLSRTSGYNGTLEWRQPIWFETSIQSSSAGYDMIFLDIKCADEGDNVTFYSSNLGLRSEARGIEIVPLYGGLQSRLEPLWQVPNLEVAPPEPSLNPLDVKEGWDLGDAGLVAAAPLVAGTGIGLLGAFGLARRLSSTRWLKGLPELAMIFVVLAILLLPAVAGVSIVPVPDPLDNDRPGEPEATLPVASGRPAAIAPPPMAPPRAKDSAPDEGATSGMDVGGPYGDLLRRVAHEAAQDTLTPAAHAAAMRDYMAALGYEMPRESRAPFDDNETLAYTRPVGDVDADGVDDVLMEEWCLSYDGCPWTPTYIGYPDPAQYVVGLADGGDCGRAHRLAVRSGLSGAEVWNATLNEKHPVRHLGCTENFVMGQLPTPDGHMGILVYKFEVFRPALVEWYETITHTFELIDVTSGQPAWSYTVDGFFAWNYALKEGITHAENFLINPIIQNPVPRQGINVFGNVTPTLHFQSVGFEFAYLDTFMGVPPQIGHFAPFVTIIHTYQANEWVARVDLTKAGGNNELFRVDTFDSEADRSVLPYILPNGRPAWYDTPYPFERIPNDPLYYTEEPGWMQDQYWNSEECCFDLNGDGVNDLVYKTIEWNGLPPANVRGPYFYDATIVAFDGATGRKLYDVTLVKDTKVDASQGFLIPDLFRFEITSQAAGDLDGDAMADYLVHIAFYDYDYERQLVAIKGDAGSTIWRLDAKRDLDALVAGDADGDGGNDVAVIEYIDWEHYWSNNQMPPQFNYWWIYNVTRNPLVMYSGADGAEIWRTHTWQAPADLLAAWKNHHRNGLPDLNSDGVGDLLFDDPTLLRDLTIVHRQDVRSGKDLSLLWTFRSVGSFSIPIPAGDGDGDGLPDLAVLSGDRTDLWITLFDGQDGSPAWSRRLLETRMSSSGTTVPNVDWLRLNVAGDPVPRYLINLQLVTVTYRSIYLVTKATSSQLLGIEPASGNRTWSLPGLEGGPNETVYLGQPTPASALYLDQYEGYPLVIAGTYPTTALRWQVASATFGGSALISFGLGFRRWKP